MERPHQRVERAPPELEIFDGSGLILVVPAYQEHAASRIAGGIT